MRIIRIPVEGAPSVAVIDGYEDMRAEVGGLIEPVDIFEEVQGAGGLFGATLWLNEEGKLIGLPYNPVADSLAHNGQPGLHPGDRIMGNVFLTGPTDEEGDTTDAPDWLIKLVGLT